MKISSTRNFFLCRKFATVCRNFVVNFQCLSENDNFPSRLLFYPTMPLTLRKDYDKI